VLILFGIAGKDNVFSGKAVINNFMSGGLHSSPLMM
jgi:hypothetical protein